MDTSLCQYKGKLKEALDIVRAMDPEDHTEVVTFWNDRAIELQNIVQSVTPTYNLIEPDMELHNSDTIYTNNINTNTLTLVQDSENLFGSATYLDPATLIEKQAKNISAPVSLTPAIHCYPDVGDPVQEVTTMAHGQQYNLLKQMPISSEVSMSTSVMSYPSSDPSGGNTVKIEDALSSDLDICNETLANTLSYHRTTGSTVPEEIGNGQFDRGPDVVYSGLPLPATFTDYSQCHQVFNHQVQVNDDFPVSKVEMFTQCDRPLQPIQLFSSGQSDLDPRQQVTPDATPTIDVKIKSDQVANVGGDYDMLKQQNTETFAYNMDSAKSVDTSKSFEKPNVNNNKAHTCEVCGKSGFSTKGNLKRHQKAHSGEKPFKCDWCSSCFTEKKSLKIHQRRHTGEKPYKCNVCGKLFSQTGVLQSHMALHLNERKFDCQKCGKAFRQRSQLKLHLMRHDGVKRLECSTCQAKFLTKGDLERHCRIHTGERPYACTICSKTFTRQQSLNEHLNRHTGEKPYDCKYCDKTFSEMSACYKHSKIHKKQEQDNSAELKS